MECHARFRVGLPNAAGAGLDVVNHAQLRRVAIRSRQVQTLLEQLTEPGTVGVRMHLK